MSVESVPMSGLTDKEREILDLLNRKVVVQRECFRLRAEIDELQTGLALNEAELTTLVGKLGE